MKGRNQFSDHGPLIIIGWLLRPVVIGEPLLGEGCEVVKIYDAIIIGVELVIRNWHPLYRSHRYSSK